ncbi:MAG TPA: hypothetical protein VM328_10490 [Fimbriimonadaceae bacterium]|nr:hypothetical protein [Fimbriimonadaceae bacterium]
MGGRPGPLESRVEASISILGEKDHFLSLEWLVEVTEDFLVFEWHYEAPTPFLPWRDPAIASGSTRMWIPWTSIGYVYRNRDAK